MPQFFERYIHPVAEEDLLEALSHTLKELEQLDLAALGSLGDKVYAPGKWTVREILQHGLDNERIQSYRAMRIARNDKTVLPGYEEELLAAHSEANNRALKDIAEEWVLLRKSNILMFKNMSSTSLHRIGNAYKVQITPLALGFVLAGHQRHHLQVIHERYLSLM